MGKKLGIFGGLFTAFYLAGLLCLLYGRWGELKCLPLNELGDFLAGAFGPLAILWLVLGFFQQGVELRQNSAALQLQARELKNSVEQQEKLAKTATDHLDHEKSLRVEEKELQRQRAQPKLSFTPGRAEFGSGTAYYRVLVANNGRQDCTDLLFTFDEVGIEPIRLQRLTSGSPIDIGLHIYQDTARQFSGLLRFFDGQGEPGELHLEVVINSDYAEMRIKNLKPIFQAEQSPHEKTAPDSPPGGAS